jgi:hypothetical protein
MRKHANRTDNQALERGQSFVEAALGFVFFLIFLMGLFDLGRAFFIFVALEDSAGEAALYLAINKDCPKADAGSCADPNNAEYRAKNASGDQLNWSKVVFNEPEYLPDTGAGEMVKVKLEYPFDLLTPIITNIVGSNTLTLTAEATEVLLPPPD